MRLLQVKRDTAVLPQYRRPPMTLRVRSTNQYAAEGSRGFSVQLLSLKDTFASVGRLADQSNRPSSSSSDVRLACIDVWWTPRFGLSCLEAQGLR